MHWFARLFMLIWLSAFLLIWAVLAVQSAISTNSLSDKLMSFILPLLMFAFGLGLIHLGRWFSRGDIAFLEQAIKHALHHGDT
jgi:hypothetical protein